MLLHSSYITHSLKQLFLIDWYRSPQLSSESNFPLTSRDTVLPHLRTNIDRYKLFTPRFPFSRPSSLRTVPSRRAFALREIHILLSSQSKLRSTKNPNSRAYVLETIRSVDNPSLSGARNERSETRLRAAQSGGHDFRTNVRPAAFRSSPSGRRAK